MPLSRQPLPVVWSQAALWPWPCGAEDPVGHKREQAVGCAGSELRSGGLSDDRGGTEVLTVSVGTSVADIGSVPGTGRVPLGTKRDSEK